MIRKMAEGRGLEPLTLAGSQLSKLLPRPAGRLPFERTVGGIEPQRVIGGVMVASLALAPSLQAGPDIAIVRASYRAYWRRARGSNSQARGRFFSREVVLPSVTKPSALISASDLID
jgi:hypothetical protein